MKLFLALILGLGTVAVAKEFRPVNPHSALPIPTCDPNTGECQPGGN